MTQSQTFWNSIADSYAAQPVADPASYQYKLERTREHFHPDMRLLEFGCGTGSTALAHAPFVGSIRAIDSSERMIEIARGKAGDLGVTNVSFEQCALEELEAGPTYDLVLGMSILHLVDDRQAALERVFALLEPGGVFISSTACAAEMNPLLRLVLPLLRAIGRAPRVHLFSVAELEAEIRAAGFEITELWQPGRGKAVFIQARRPEAAA